MNRTRSLIVAAAVALLAASCALFTPSVKQSLEQCQVTAAVDQEGLLLPLVFSALTDSLSAAEGDAKLTAIEASGAFAADDVDCMAAQLMNAVESVAPDAGGNTAMARLVGVARAVVERHLAGHGKVRKAAPAPAAPAPAAPAPAPVK